MVPCWTKVAISAPVTDQSKRSLYLFHFVYTRKKEGKSVTFLKEQAYLDLLYLRCCALEIVPFSSVVLSQGKTAMKLKPWTVSRVKVSKIPLFTESTAESEI